MKKILQFLLFLGLGVTVLWLVFRSQNAAFQEQCRLDRLEECRLAGIPPEQCPPPEQCSLIDKLIDDFSTVHIGWMLLVVAAFTVSNIFRAARWQMLLSPMGYRAGFANSLLTILLGYFANLGFPRMGEVMRAAALSRYERIPVEKVMGTMVTDRLMDFFCLALVMALAFGLEGQTLLQFINEKRNASGAAPDDSWGGRFIWMVLIVLALGALAAFIFWEKLLHLPVAKKIGRLLRGFWEGLRSVLKLKNPTLFIAYSLGIWLMFYLQCWFNLQAFPPTAHLSASAAMMVFVFGTLGMVVPSPGGMGTFHAAAIGGLALYGIASPDAFSYANIAFFAIQIFYNLVGGVLALVLLPVLNRKKQTEKDKIIQ